jgi:hypothetical protein
MKSGKCTPSLLAFFAIGLPVQTTHLWLLQPECGFGSMGIVFDARNISLICA